jgi:hypothetical protein
MEISYLKQDVCDKLCRVFKVDAQTCEAFENLYNEKIEGKLRLRHLSHLVSTIEDMINDLYKQRFIIPLLNKGQYSEEQKRELVRKNYRLYSILLRPIKGLNSKGFVTHHNYGSIIVYNPDIMNERDVRILVAHELGHIINLYIHNCQDTQNRANVFCYFAINGKDQFYKNEAEHFTYTSELAIIDDIFKICPITKNNQT